MQTPPLVMQRPASEANDEGVSQGRCVGYSLSLGERVGVRDKPVRLFVPLNKESLKPTTIEDVVRI
jgi:hypothetical protein